MRPIQYTYIPILGLALGSQAMGKSALQNWRHSPKTAVVAAHKIDSQQSAIDQVSASVSKSRSDIFFWNRTADSKDDSSEFSTSLLSASIGSKLPSLGGQYKYIVVVDQLKSTTTLPRAPYAKREFAVIPSSSGYAKVEIFDVSQGQIVGAYEATSPTETSSSPLESGRVMKQALDSALLQFLTPSK